MIEVRCTVCERVAARVEESRVPPFARPFVTTALVKLQEAGVVCATCEPRK